MIVASGGMVFLHLSILAGGHVAFRPPRSYGLVRRRHR